MVVRRTRRCGASEGRRAIERLSLPRARWGVPFAVSAMALGPSILTHRYFEPSPYLPLLAAVTFSAWYGGPWSGLISTALCGAASLYLFVPPEQSLSVTASAEAFRLAIFVFAAVFATLLSSAVRREHAAAEAERHRATDAAEEAQRSRDQLDVILQGVADGIVACDERTGVVYANDSAVGILGYASADALGADPAMRHTRAWIAGGTADALIDLQHALCRRPAEGHAFREMEVRIEHLAQGVERWLVVRTARVGGARAKGDLFISVLRDVTDRKRAEQSARLLAEASDALAASLDYEATLRAIAALAVPTLADRAFVDVYDDRRREAAALEVTAAAHAEPGGDPPVKVAVEWGGMPPTGPRALPSGPFAGPRPSELTVFDRPRSCTAGSEFRSRIVVALTSRGKPLGAITLLSEDRAYGAEDLAVAEAFAARCALAVDNARLYRDAGESLRMHDEFLMTVSHDVKSPLATIKGVAQFLQRQATRAGRVDPDRLRAGTASIDSAASTIASLVDELLDVARLRAGQELALGREEADLVALARRAAETQQQATEAHRILVGGDVERLTGEWDAPRLLRVLGNLLGNAVKFSPVGGDVNVRVWAADEGGASPGDGGAWAYLSVADRGVGIPAEDLPHVFERFRRGANVAGTIAGSGIGLAGSRQIVEQHGGAIWAESREGAGATFTLKLPRRAPLPAEG